MYLNKKDLQAQYVGIMREGVGVDVSTCPGRRAEEEEGEQERECESQYERCENSESIYLP